MVTSANVTSKTRAPKERAKRINQFEWLMDCSKVDGVNDVRCSDWAVRSLQMKRMPRHAGYHTDENHNDQTNDQPNRQSINRSDVTEVIHLVNQTEHQMKFDLG